jgi:ribosomal protein S18
MQRRGREPGAPLRCHLLDLDRLNPIDITNLKRFLSFDGEILSKKLTGLCARCQRQVARTVKTSRSMGILPHLGYVHLTDLQPSRHNQSFHKVVRDGGKRNKPILSKLIPVR